MPLDPQARAVLEQMAAAGIQPPHTLSVAAARQALIERRRLTAGAPEPIAHVADRSIPGPGGPLPIRIYRPAAAAPLPTLVYFHGGGWVLGSIETHDGICRALANAGACQVVSVEYRLAPEHRFPAAVEDAYAASAWVAANAAELGAAPDRIAVGGDSAGGNLAAAVCLMARDRGGPRLAFQLLLYPVTSFAFDTPSYLENAEGYMLTRADMRWFWQHYLPDEAAGRSPYASPLQAENLRGLPPALVVTAEFDPLRDEGEAYAARLQAAGVPATLRRYEGLIHGFLGMTAAIERARTALEEIGRALQEALGE